MQTDIYWKVQEKTKPSPPLKKAIMDCSQNKTIIVSIYFCRLIFCYKIKFIFFVISLELCVLALLIYFYIPALFNFIPRYMMWRCGSINTKFLVSSCSTYTGCRQYSILYIQYLIQYWMYVILDVITNITWI